MLDLITIGDSTIDVFLQISEANVRCKLKTDECELCVNYADKIPVESMTRIPGAGNASNNAIGAKRLGMQTAIFSILGNDDVGEVILKYWKKAGLDTRFVRMDKKSGTNYSTVINFRGERTILVYHEKRDYRLPASLPGSKWVYYTSMGKGSEVLHRPLLAYLKKTGARMMFQPGTYQLKLGIEKLTPIIERSEVTIMNKEEAGRLVGNETRSMNELLSRLHAYGCDIAVITDGPKGAYAYDGKRFLELEVFDVPVVERTGCGDAFATGLMAGLHYGETLAEAMRWGTANSAAKLGFIGPQKGLLTLSAIKKMLERFADIQPVEI